MWYISDIIDDLALVFLSIEQLKEKYAIYNLEIDYTILIEEKGYKVAVRPYELHS